MKIEWTPWFNVPMRNRLEVLGVTLYMLCLTILGPICGIAILFFLVKFTKCLVSNYLHLFYCQQTQKRDEIGH